MMLICIKNIYMFQLCICTIQEFNLKRIILLMECRSVCYSITLLFIQYKQFSFVMFPFMVDYAYLVDHLFCNVFLFELILHLHFHVLATLHYLILKAI